VPKKVLNLNIDVNNKVYKICCGGMHTLVLTTMGKVFSWGNNDDGALGREGADNQPMLINGIDVPVSDISAGDSHSTAYNPKLNVLYVWGSYRVKLLI
jgi:regulator of chromosome condensation